MNQTGLNRHERVGMAQRQQILDFIRDYRGKYNMSPSQDEIAAAIGLEPDSYGNVNRKIRALVEEGWLYRVGKGHRNLMLVQPSPAAYYWREEEVQE